VVWSTAKTVKAFLASLPEGQRKTIDHVRRFVKRNLPKGFEEGMLDGGISWYVPLETFGDTFNGKPLVIAGLAAHDTYNTLFLFAIYGNEKVRREFEKQAKKMGRHVTTGKTCVRFQAKEDLPYDLVAYVASAFGPDAVVEAYQRGEEEKKLARRRAARKTAASRRAGRPKQAPARRTSRTAST